MKISIAMATYNGAAYLGAQLESFIAQSEQPDELVVTDDQSNDSTIEIVRAFAARAPFTVRFEINPTRLGSTLNFDRTLGMCTGDLIFLSDQDDVWLPEKIAELKRAAEQHPDKSCFINDAYLADSSLRSVGVTKMQQIASAGLPQTAMVQGCCAAFRRDLLSCLLPIPPGQRAHDNWLVQMADLLGQTVRLPDPLQFYRRHGGNASDFFVNRLHTPTRWRLVIEWGANVLRRATDQRGFDSELGFYSAAVDRLAEREPRLLAAVGIDRLYRSMNDANKIKRLLVRRKEIRTLPRGSRLPFVCKLLRENAYASSGGVKGAIKDLMLPWKE